MKSLSIFDCNIHSPSEKGWSHRDFEEVELEMSKSNTLGGNVIYFPKPGQIPLPQLVSMCTSNGKLEVIRVIDPFNEDIKRAIFESFSDGVIGFKLHPRIYRHHLDNDKIIEICETISEFNSPLLICTFPDGSWNRIKLNNNQFFDLASRFPDQKFVWMHAGGHRVTEFIFAAKRNKNVYLDTSFTQNYFKFGVVPTELAHGLFSTQGSNWIFGSDYPHFPFNVAREALLNIMKLIPTNYSIENLEQKIFLENACKVFPQHRFFNQRRQ